MCDFCTALTRLTLAQEKDTNEAYSKIKSLAKAFHANISDKTDAELAFEDGHAVLAKMSKLRICDLYVKMAYTPSSISG